ncbi:hypothetical protein FKM82_031018 [Ascaphus truei]
MHRRKELSCSSNTDCNANIKCRPKRFGSNSMSTGSTGVSSGDLRNVAHIVPIARGTPYVPPVSARVARDRQKLLLYFHNPREGEIEFEMDSTDEDKGYSSDDEEGSDEENWDIDSSIENWDRETSDENWYNETSEKIAYISRRCLKEVYGHDPLSPLVSMPELWAVCGCPVCHPECYSVAALNPVDHAVRRPP